MPVVVAKCGLFLKETATEVEGTFRISGSAKRMRELQAIFDTGPKVGGRAPLMRRTGQATDRSTARTLTGRS